MCEIAGISFPHYLWNAPVPMTEEDWKEIHDSPSGAVALKTTTLYPRKGSPNAWHVDTKGNSWNAIGLDNPGLCLVIRDLTHLKWKLNKPVLMSVAGKRGELLSMISTINALTGHLTMLLEWNVSCPNVSNEEKEQWSVEAIEKVYTELRNRSLHPIGIKFGKTTRDEKAHIVEKVKPQFITCMNSYDGQGGIQIREMALKEVREWHKLNPDLTIIGVGGISCQQDVQDMLNAGATAVEIGTAYLQHGPKIFSMCCEGWLELCYALITNKIVQKRAPDEEPFRLSSGQLSYEYADFRRLSSYPVLWTQIITRLRDRIASFMDEIDLICGVPLGGISLASWLAFTFQKPLLLFRKEGPKEHGTRQKIEGVYQPGQTCLLVEDVITTGKSVAEVIGGIDSAGIITTHVVCFLDRSDGTLLSKEKVWVHSLFHPDDLFPLCLVKKPRRPHKCCNFHCLGVNALKQRADTLLSVVKRQSRVTSSDIDNDVSMEKENAFSPQ